MRATIFQFGENSEWSISAVVRVLTDEFGSKIDFRDVGWALPSVNGFISSRELIDRAAQEQPEGILGVVLTPFRIMTPFGYEIAGQSDNSVIVARTTVPNEAALIRLFRHEMGHFAGLSEHLDCVMSRYFVEVPNFCDSCLRALSVLGYSQLPTTVPHLQNHS